jgi:ABC-type amino acid transport substrate-binding protein/nitrogen-specific signal transduction histidine kinase
LFSFRIFIIFIVVTFSYSSIDISSKKLSLSNTELDYISNNVVKIGMLEHYNPFSFTNKSQRVGFSYDLLNLISIKTGIKFQYVIDTWPNNLKNFRDKKLDMIDSISFEESRIKYTRFTKPYYEVPLMIFSRKDLDNYRGLKSLKGKRLGIIKDVFFKEYIERLKLFDIVEYTTNEDKIQALSSGQVDLIFGPLQSTQQKISLTNSNNIKVLDELRVYSIKKEDLRFGINRDNPVLFSIITKAMSYIRPFEYKLLKDKWLGEYSSYFPSNFNVKSLKLSSEEQDFISNTNIRCILPDYLAPIQFSNKGILEGVALDYFALITKDIGIDIKCTPSNSFSNIFEEIENKKVDVTIATSITKNKLRYSNFSKSYLSYPVAILTTKDKVFINEISLLNTKTLVIIDDSAIVELIKFNYPKIKYIIVDSYEKAIDIVKNKLAYGLIDVLPILSYKINQSGYNDIKIGGISKLNIDFRIMVRDDYAQLISIFNKSIDRITYKDKIDIYDKWSLPKYKYIEYYNIYIFLLVFLSIIVVYFLFRHYLLMKKYNRELKYKIGVVSKDNKKKDGYIIHQSRLAQMGELISIIAHQWRQPLNFITSTTLRISMKLDPQKPNSSIKISKKELVDYINKECSNIDNYIDLLSDTLEHFRNFYKPNRKPFYTDISHPLDHSMLVMRKVLHQNNINLVENYNSKLQISLFSNELSQVFMNIIKNSQDSFIINDIKYKTITISTKDIDNKGVQIEFRDNAGGIKKDIRDKILDPYFSTKGDKHGTGIGLYISKIIVEDHHKGNLDIDYLDDGISLIIFLPNL